MEQRLEEASSCSTSQEIQCYLCNQKRYYGVFKSPALGFILRHKMPFQVRKPYFVKIHFNIILPSIRGGGMSQSVQRLGYGLDVWGSIFGKSWEFFSSQPRPDRLWGPPSLLSKGKTGSSPGGKVAGRETDHSPPSASEVNECVEVYLHSPIRLHGVVIS
jgi:hypothetical protein